MEVTKQVTMRTCPINGLRKMLILAIEKFTDLRRPGSRDIPGNMHDGRRLKATYQALGFDVNFDQNGSFTKDEADEAIRNFVDNMNPAVDMAGMAIMSHGDFDDGGQVIEFSDGRKANLAMGQQYSHILPDSLNSSCS